MKRDMDLIRAILLEVEAAPSGFAPSNIEIPGYTQEQIRYHAYLLNEAGLVNGIDVTSHGSKGPEMLITKLTWKGYEFLDSARENKIWNQAKGMIYKVGGASLPIWTALLTDIIKKQLGL